MKPLYLLIALFFLMVTVVPAPAGETRSVTLRIEGMSCTLCAPAVKKALSSVDGVENVKVSFKDKRAFVEYDDEKATIQEMLKAVEDVGFRAGVVK